MRREINILSERMKKLVALILIKKMFADWMPGYLVLNVAPKEHYTNIERC